MTRLLCQGCGAALQDVFVCPGCADHLRDQLYRVRALEEDLELSLARVAKLGSDGPGIRVRAAETPLVFNWDAAEALYGLTATVQAWARALAEAHAVELQMAPPLPMTDPRDPARIFPRRGAATECAGWLAEHIGWVTTHPQAGQIVAELDDALRQAVRVIDRAPDRRYLGPCLEADELAEDGVCRADLYAPPRAVWVACPGCGVEHDTEARRDWLLRAAQDQLITVPEASRALPALLGREVTTVTINTLVRQGKITAHPAIPGSSGWALFRLGDMVDALLAEAAAAKKPRRVRHLFTAAEAEKKLKIPAATVRSWANRSRISALGTNGRGAPTYDRDELLELRGAT